MPAAPDRRLVILAEGNFGFHHGKTAMGVIRYGTDRVVAVIDSTQAGRNVREWLGDSGRFDIPIVDSLNAALGFLPRADALLIGIAPTGGRLPDDWRVMILAAIRSGLDVISGLHTFLGDDQEFVDAARSAGVRLIDVRRPPDRMETAVGRLHEPGKRVILTVGTDCAIGKMSVALELRRAAVAAGRSASFVATGQTGIMIDGWGVAIDRVVADFVEGMAEWLGEEGERRGDWVIVEGQGSLDHPAYSSVTLGLIHGFTPHAMVMVHKPGLADHDWDHVPGRRFPLADLPSFITTHERVAALVAPSRVVAVALNTSLLPDESEARRVIEATAIETGLPVADPVRFGADGLWREIETAVEALPWVEPAVAGGTGVTLSLRLRTLELPLRDPFLIARSSHGEGVRITTVVAELRDLADGPDGPIGLGEGYPDPYYGDTPATMAAIVPALLDALAPIEADLRGGLDDVRAALEDADGLMTAAVAHHGAAKCAIDIALHDLAGKRLGLPVRELIGMTGDPPPTDFTLGLDEPGVVAERARRAGDFPALKIKVGGAADLETLRAVRDVYAGPIRVDANTGWTPEAAVAILPELERLGVELIEQPFPARRLDQLRWLQERCPLPLVADESAVTIEDLDALVGVVAGVNVKLAKCGGLGPARRMLERARSLGFRTFLGCMEETSIGIAASAAVAPLAEWIDLDGNLLLGDDPASGLELGPDKRWRLADRPGLGLTLRDDARP